MFGKIGCEKKPVGRKLQFSIDKEKAIIAIARLLLTSIYHILLTGEIFDYERFDTLLNRNFKSNKHSLEEMISYLTSLGYSITIQNT